MFKAVVITIPIGLVAGFGLGLFVGRNWVGWREKAKAKLKEKL